MDLYEDPQISTEGLVKSHSVGWSTILLASAWRCAVAMEGRAIALFSQTWLKIKATPHLS